jgi:simple sugar transport system ATP-binding protein
MLEVIGLRVKDTRGLLAVKNVSITVRGGEIVGVAGVSGNGQTELALSLAGLIEELEFDEIRLAGNSLDRRDLTDLNRLKTAHIPEDRQKMGVILPFSVAENFILEEFRDPKFSRGGFLRMREIHDHSMNLVKKFGIRVANVNDAIANLSGGNQQKVVVARELERNPRFLLVNQPTRGIDVGATEFVHQQILEQRQNGTAILLISTDLEEIFALSDRILVMFEGEIIGELPADRSLLEEAGLMMAGKRGQPRLWS